ncbi:MAG: DUF1080 domain-containing protein [Acidobacteria bacterium]|nr:DUF1080 domain-containing protein [Acidobacteriota bacterium]
MMHRRSFLAASAAFAAQATTGWLDLFDGQSLQGWKANSNPASWKVREGLLTASGPVSHLFYTERSFKNFEFEAEVFTRPGCNSGIYFHTAFQDSGFPKKGFEVQINNTALGEGTYREQKRTGSLYSMRNVPQQLANDEEWSRLAFSVRGKNIQVRVNGLLTVDYTEPATPVMPPTQETGRNLSDGLFALQCHDPNSVVQFRHLRVRPLPDNEPTPGDLPPVDDTYRKIIDLGAKNFPLVDWHVHLKPGLGLKEALERSRRDGIYYGISANCGRQSQYKSDAELSAFIDGVKGNAAFVGMQAEGADWQKIFTRHTTDRVDYIFNDGLIWTDDKGRWTRIYRPQDIGPISNPQAFIDELIDRTVHLLTSTPMDILAIPTFLPESLMKDHAALWTEPRMLRIIEAAVKHKVAIEMSDRYRLPSLRFLELAKQAGCKFTLGTGNSTSSDLRRSEYGLEMIDKLKLSWQHLWVPTRRPII